MHWFKSVLVAVALGALKRDHYLVEAEFDPTFGYPVSASLGSSEMADDYFILEVANFKNTP